MRGMPPYTRTEEERERLAREEEARRAACIGRLRVVLVWLGSPPRAAGPGGVRPFLRDEQRCVGADTAVKGNCKRTCQCVAVVCRKSLEEDESFDTLELVRT